MRCARIYPWRRTRRSRAPSNGPDAYFVAQFSAGYTTNMFGFDLRQGQPTEAALLRGLSPVLWLYVRHLWTGVRPRVRFVNLGQKIGGFPEQGRRKLIVVCGSRELKKRRRLTQEIVSTDHFAFPVVSHQRRRRYYAEAGAFVPNRKYKSELKGGGLTSAAVARPSTSPSHDPFSADRGGRNPSTGTPVVPRRLEAALVRDAPRNWGKSVVPPGP
jgi:hypothetical protein